MPDYSKQLKDLEDLNDNLNFIDMSELCVEIISENCSEMVDQCNFGDMYCECKEFLQRKINENKKDLK